MVDLIVTFLAAFIMASAAYYGFCQLMYADLREPWKTVLAIALMAYIVGGAVSFFVVMPKPWAMP